MTKFWLALPIILGRNNAKTERSHLDKTNKIPVKRLIDNNKIGQNRPDWRYLVYGSMMIHQENAPNMKPHKNLRMKFASEMAEDLRLGIMFQ